MLVIDVPFEGNRCIHFVFLPLVFVDVFLSPMCLVENLHVLEKVGGGTLCPRVNTVNTNIQGKLYYST